MDDLYIIVWNPLVHSLHGAWRAFGAPYWPPDLGGQMYRPLPLATFAVDWTIAHGHPAWFHAVNLLWHAGVAVIVTALALRSPSPEGRGGQGVRTAALAAGLVFAVHPVHVEAVANVIGLGELMAAAAVFLGESAFAGRLTALAALGDVLRLLVFPLTLRADYSPAERTIVRSLLDGRFLIGLACLALWAGLLVMAWRRQRRVEAYGLGWIAIAFLPVSNLLFSTGVLLAERTLYLPSVGLALAAGAALARLPVQRFRVALALIVLAGGIRSGLRTPVWHDDFTVTQSILEDSPQSYRGPARMGAIYQSHRQPERALAALHEAMRIYDRDPTLFVAGADAALTLDNSRLADSMLARAELLCYRCSGSYRTQALAARSRGDSAVADSLLARMR